MKILNVKTLILASFMALAVPEMSFGKDYPLICRGMKGNDRIEVAIFWVAATGFNEVNVMLWFTPGTKAALNSSGKPQLKEGECSWVDRGFRKGEREIIYHNIQDVPFLKMKASLNLSHNRSYIVGNDSMGIPYIPRASSILFKDSLNDPNAYWTFYVHNNGEAMLASKVCKGICK